MLVCRPTRWIRVCYSIFLFILFISEPLAGVGPAQAQPQSALSGKNVLILHGFEASMPINVMTDRGLRTRLDSGGIGPQNQFFEYLNLVPDRGPEYRKRLADLLRIRYSHRKVDMIITLYTDALQFLLNEARDLFPDVPILPLNMPGVQLPRTNRRLIRNEISYDMAGTLEIALKLVPGAKRVYVLSGTAGTDKKMENQARNDFKKWEGRLEFHYLSDMPLEQMLTAVSSVPADSIILFVAFIADSAGKTYTSREVVQEVSRVAKAPLFGLYDTLLGYGIAGGSLASYERSGSETGDLALKVLASKLSPENIPSIVKVPPVPMFDWRQLRHWKLNEAALPKESIVINREVTLWDFKHYIIGGLTFFLLETALIIFLVVQRRRKKMAEDSLRQKTEELDQFFSVNLDLLCIANTDGYFLRLNPAWERILGYSREELMSKHFLEFVHPDDLQRTQEAVSAQALDQKVVNFENRYRCKDGTYRWLQWNSTPVGKLIYAAARDITESKRTEEDLKKSEERFRMLVETMNEGLGVRDENGTWTYVNDQLCGILGQLPGDIIGHPVKQFLDEMNQKVFGKEIEKQRQGHYESYEITWTRSDGRKITTIASPKPIFSEGRLKEIFVVITDITDRKQAEDALKDRLRFERLVSDLSAGFLNVAPHAVDREIERALKEIVDFFNVSHAMLIKGSTDEQTAFITHAATANNVPPSPLEGNLYLQFPWTSSVFGQNEIIRVTALDGLPAEASSDKEIYKGLGVLSFLMVPIVIEGSTRYVVSISSRREERVWPEDYIPRLELLGKIFVNSIARKDAEQALRESEERFREVTENVADFIWEVDADGLYTFTSTSVERILGYSPGELVGKKHFYDLFIPNVREELKAAALEVFAARGSFRALPNPNLSKDGKIVHLETSGGPVLDKSGKLVGYRGADTDVTKRKQAEEKLSESEERLRLVLEANSEGVWDWNIPSGHAVFSPRYSGMLGYTPEEFAKSYLSWKDLVHPDDFDRVNKAHADHIYGGEEFCVELRMRKKSGDWCWILSRGMVVERDAEGKAIRMVGTHQDITERKRAEEELSKHREHLEELIKERTRELEIARDQAESANRAKSAFLANMSHELRTPLNSILGIAQLMERDVGFPHGYRDVLKVLSGSGAHLLELINDVLELSKIESGKISLDRTSFDVHSFLADVEEMMRLRASEKHLKLLFEYHSPLPQYIETDVRKLRQILINLLGNAIKYTEKGGVTLKIAFNKSREKTSGAFSSLDGRLEFEVQDTGIGVAPQDTERIFQPFVQVNPRRTATEGTGLGLTLSRMFADLLGGEMTLRSQLGKGSTFAFHFPVRLAEAAAVHTQEKDRQVVQLMPGQPHYRLLVVDDSMDNRLVLRRLLEQVGFDVLEAASGQEAIEVYTSGQPQLIWMDVRMPGMDGNEAARRIREMESGKEIRTPIIAFTAGVMKGERPSPDSRLFDGWVYKPFRESEIFQIIEQHLGVQFVYQPSVGAAGDGEEVRDAIDLKQSDLLILSRDWLTEFYAALKKGRSAQLLKLIDQIRTPQRELADTLAGLVRTHRFDKLITVTEGALRENSDG